MWQAIGLTAAILGGLALISIVRRNAPQERALKWQLANAPRTPIGRLRSGSVACVSGRVRGAGELLQAPLSGRRCLAFQITVDETAAGESRSVTRLVRASPFWIDDGTGRALVDPGARFALALVRDMAVRTSWSDERPGDPLRDFLESQGVVTTSCGAPRRLPCREGVIEEGVTVAVGGYVIEEVDPRGDAVGPRRPPTVIALRGGGPDEPLLISDAPEAVRRPLLER